MPRLIFKCPHIKAGASKTHAANTVEYIATRDGVDFVTDANRNKPATVKQKELIDKIVRDYPDSQQLFEFEDEGFTVTHCLIDGKKTVLAEYIAKNNVDTKLPLVGDYSGNGVNISIKAIEDGVVSFYAPVFSSIKYRLAKPVENYANEFNARISKLKNTKAVFSCNCILNFLYGELEGKRLEAFAGPVTFGEIAYQLVNQTLVYVTVEG